MDRIPNAIAKDSGPHSAAMPSPPMILPTPAQATPTARLASKDFHLAPARNTRSTANWLAWQIGGWTAFLGFLLALSGLLLALVYGVGRLVETLGGSFSLGQAIGNILALILVLVMITATLLTMADRKWSALMQDRVGPNRARLPIPGLSNSPLAGLPHILADVFKMLFKEDFISEGAARHKLLFNLAPLFAFAPAFCLFAVVPVGPDVIIDSAGRHVQLMVAHLDWGILYVFALASLGVFGTALAGWTSDNKLALLGGLRASAQLVSYEVTLGLTLVGTFIVFGTLRLDEMVAAQGAPGLILQRLPADPSLLWGVLPSWGFIFQPIGMLLFLVAAMAEIKRPPFDTPEGESEIIGYFLEYSGLKSGMFLIAEYAETVVVAGIVTSMFLGGYHIPWFEPQLARAFDRPGIDGTLVLAVAQIFAFIVKMLAVIWVMFLARWAFPRFRYDQIMRLGWKMMLPISLANVVVSAGVFLAGGREGLAVMGIVEWIALLSFLGFSGRSPVKEAEGHGGDGHQVRDHDAAAAAHAQGATAPAGH
ncbi:MAG TPA: complex I subunit 1 family protein [Myxococcales bacterium]|nr:complex I subunit 1 family protein [Myxococcales bacterium]